MIKVSDEFEETLNNDKRNFAGSCTIILTNGTTVPVEDSDIWDDGFKFDDATSNNSTFDIGSAIVQKFTLILNNCYGDFTEYDFTGAEISDVNVSLELPSEKTETISKGVFTVSETSYDGDLITLECLDNMHKFDVGYSKSNLVYPATLLQIVQDACSCCNMVLATDSLQFEYYNYVISTRPDDESITFRDVLTWVGQISGHFWKCNAKGQLSAGWYNMEDLEKEENIHIFGLNTVTDLTADMDDVVITGVKIITENADLNQVTVQSGSDGYVLAIDSNKFITADNASEIASMIGGRVVGLRFRPLSASLLQDPTVEAGDGAVVYDSETLSYKTFITNVEFSLDDDMQVSNDAESALRHSSERFSEAAKVYQSLKSHIQKNKSEWEKAYDELKKAMEGKNGLYPVMQKQEDGSTILNFCDTPTLEDAAIVVRLSAGGWGMSTDGGKTWNVGALVDGTTITKILNAIGINADWINTGALTVADEDGNIIFQVDIEKKSVYMNPDILTIGDSTLTEKLKDMDNDIASAKNVSMQLTNELQVITADSEGNIPVFPVVTTKAIVMYGTKEVTDACAYTITKSADVTGSWDNDTHTYTVTELTADDGWIDIKAVYLNIAVTKRFTISKQKAGEKGENGEPGRTYSLEASCDVIKLLDDDVLEPSYIDFAAYMFDGTSTERKDYMGIYVIEESSDGGKTWEEMYRSESNEHAVRHHLYPMLKNLTGGILVDSNRCALATVRTITNVKCSFYAYGMYPTGAMPESKKIASKTFTVVDETTPTVTFTQSQIVEILSNNGKFKGFYYIGDELYVSLSALLGGEMTLGGENNGGGLFRLRDANNNLIGKFDKDGLLIVNPDLQNGGYLLGKNGIQFIVAAEGDEIVTELGGSFGVAIVDDELKVFLEAYQIDADYALIDEVIVSTINPSGAPLIIGGDTTINGHQYLKNVGNASGSYALRLGENALVYKTSSSSRRYKKIGAKISKRDIADWYNIQPVWAKYKDGYLAKGDEREGVEFPMFIAEDVEKYMPLAVDHLPDGRVETWNERIMIPAMFAMLKSQKEKLDQQDKLINNLYRKLGYKKGE